jgi:hypothetical protein
MSFYKIQKYSGRTGNNLLHILSFLYLVEKDNIIHFTIAPHNIFSLRSILDIHDTQTEIKTFNNEMLLSLSLYTLKIIYRKYLQANLRPVPQSYDVGIHIRSGDIFQGRGHKLYLQPPLYYYEKVIEEYHDRSKIIVFENKANPVIPTLIEKYKNTPNIHFQSKTLEEDIMVLSQCRTLVCSVGTFCLVPFIVSNSIQKLVVPDYFVKNSWFTFDNVDTDVIELPGYCTGEWANTNVQNKKLIHYTI